MIQGLITKNHAIMAGVAAVALIVVAISYGGVQAQNDQKPNIVFIVADDLGYGDISAYKNDWISTPHIDSLGQSGVRFTDGHVSAAVCAPSRAGFMTGRAGTRHGSEFNRGDGVRQDETNMGEMLGAAGYSTMAIGKWHLGMKDGRDPLSQGFDEFFGMPSGTLYINITHPEAVNTSTVVYDADLKTGKRKRPIFSGREKVEVEGYLTDVLTDKAVDFIDRKKSEPFFLYLAHFAPHAPLQTTKKYYDRYAHIKNHDKRVYAAMVSAMDDGVGRIIKKLKTENIFDNTIIVFISDNGCGLYLNGACSNAILSGGKRYHHEGGHRVPFFMSWPTKITGGVVYDKPTSALDLFPTFAVAGGGFLPEDRIIDGVDLVPYLTGKKDGTPHTELYWRTGPNIAVRDGKWKLVLANRVPVNEFMNMPALGMPLLNHPPQDDISPLGRHAMLYNLEEDVGEEHNVAEQHPEIVADLLEKFKAWNENNVPGNQENASGEIIVIDGEVIELQF